MCIRDSPKGIQGCGIEARQEHIDHDQQVKLFILHAERYIFIVILETVSYTHLDVYKRQATNMALCSRVTCKSAGIVTLVQLFTIGPVGDVYKRQGLYRHDR